MKTATELFNKHFRGTDYEGQFEDALAERDKEWRDKFKTMIKKEREEYYGDYPDEGYIQALQELLEETK